MPKIGSYMRDSKKMRNHPKKNKKMRIQMSNSKKRRIFILRLRNHAVQCNLVQSHRKVNPHHFINKPSLLGQDLKLNQKNKKSNLTSYTESIKFKNEKKNFQPQLNPKFHKEKKNIGNLVNSYTFKKSLFLLR